MSSRFPSGSKRKNEPSSSTSKQPADKRQKYDEDWDDDEFCLSQADYQNIDSIASQALSSKHSSSSHVKSAPGPSPYGARASSYGVQGASSHGVQGASSRSAHYPPSHSAQEPSPYGVQGASSHSVQEGSSRGIQGASSHTTHYPPSHGTQEQTSSHDPTFRAPKSSLSLKKQTSSSSNGSDSTYPSSNDTYRRSSSSSSSSLSSSSSTSNGQSSVTEPFRDELHKWKTDCLKVNEEKKIIENEIYMKDGEIKNLRRKLNQKDLELNNMRSEKSDKFDEQKQLQSDREKNLKLNCDKLETRLQFRENEYSELEEKTRILEHKLQLLHTASPKKSTPKKSTPTKVQHSPKLRHVEATSSATSPRPVKGQFPTSNTFSSDERPERSKPSTSTLHPVVSSDEAMEGQGAGDRIRRCVLNKTIFSTVEMSGSSLVSKLLENDRKDVRNVTEKGIIGLLNVPSVTPTLKSMQFDRDSSSLLSPVKTKTRKTSGNKGKLENEVKPIVVTEHYHLAIHGLQTLLSCDHSAIEDLHSDANHSEFEDLRSDANHSAVLILPLLHDYISHYISMLNLNPEDNPISPTNSSSLKSSSCESSLESLTSSLGLLLRDGALYAQNIETLTLAALAALKHLVTFSATVRELLYPKSEVPKQPDKGKSPVKQNITEVESDRSTMLSNTQSTCGNLLNLVIQLATPTVESLVFNCHVVRRSLDVLNVLARKTPVHKLDSLACLTGVLTSCFQCESYCVILNGAVSLLTTLAQSEKIRNIISSASASCCLSALYMLCMKPLENISLPERITIDKNIIGCMLSLCWCKNGVSSVLETACICASEVHRACVLLVYRVYEYYRQLKDSSIRDILKQGLQLLHIQWLHDNTLSHKFFYTEYQYVSLITSLSDDVLFETEANILGELRQNGIDEEDYSDEDSMDT